MEDADLPLALEGVLFGAFGTSGQRCTATSRLIVHEKVYDQFLDDARRTARRFTVGDPLDPRTGMGPSPRRTRRRRSSSTSRSARRKPSSATGERN